jgi:hypothetical protein
MKKHTIALVLSMVTAVFVFADDYWFVAPSGAYYVAPQGGGARGYVPPVTRYEPLTAPSVQYSRRSYADAPAYSEPRRTSPSAASAYQITAADYNIRRDGSIHLVVRYTNGAEGVFLLTNPELNGRLAASYYRVTNRSVLVSGQAPPSKPITCDVFCDGHETIYDIVINTAEGAPITLKLR